MNGLVGHGVFVQGAAADGGGIDALHLLFELVDGEAFLRSAPAWMSGIIRTRLPAI